MDWKEFFVKAGLEEELSKEYGKKCPKDQLESAAKLKFDKNEEWTQADY